MISQQTLEMIRRPEFRVKLRGGDYMIPVDCKVEQEGRGIALFFPFNRELLNEVKESFEGRKWDGKRTCWTIPITFRNLFQLDALQGLNPYGRWDKAVGDSDLCKSTQATVYDYCTKHRTYRKFEPFKHQLEMASQGLIGHWFIWAAEMGLGKTLAAILLMELCDCPANEWFWLGTNASLIAAQIDFAKWKCPIKPRFMTYEALQDVLKYWPRGTKAPRGLIVDESQKVKTPSAKRSVAVKYLADNMRQDWAEQCFIGELSGTPAPKQPPDWWHQCEIACPGFVREKDIYSFRSRLGIFVKQETVPGAGSFDKLLAWRDDEKKCNICGKPEDHVNHSDDFRLTLLPDNNQTYERHTFIKSKNEVAHVSKRLRGLVIVKLKEDCLDLPPIRYERIYVKPARATLNAAKLITSTTKRGADLLMKLRELSDGFQYRDKEIGRETCEACHGHQCITEYYDASKPDFTLTEEEGKGSMRYLWEMDEHGVNKIIGQQKLEVGARTVKCYYCDGEGTTPVYERETVEAPCPKDDVLIRLLEMHEDVGRFVVYAGFQGSVDRVIKTCHQRGWTTIRVDGRGWEGQSHAGVTISTDGMDLMRLFDDKEQEEYPRICFVGQPGAAGVGLNLTASPGEFFYSNSFNGEDRMQAVARGHRPGMDVNRGFTVYDVIHLPTDEKVLINLEQKQDLMRMSMIGLKQCLEQADAESTSD